MEAKSLKTCRNLLNKGEYDLQNVAIKVTENQIVKYEKPKVKISKKKIMNVAETDDSSIKVNCNSPVWKKRPQCD